MSEIPSTIPQPVTLLTDLYQPVAPFFCFVYGQIYQRYCEEAVKQNEKSNISKLLKNIAAEYRVSLSTPHPPF
jgi:hypothetical protein